MTDDSAPLPSPPPLTFGARLRRGRCFRTTADGRVALTDDWERLFGALAACDRLAVQTRHAYGRLIAVVPPPQLAEPVGPWRSDTTGALRCRCETWHSAWARVEPCDCCGSAGRVEVHNRHGLDFLQLCALRRCQPDDWAACIGRALPAPDAAPAGAPVEGLVPRLLDPRRCHPLEPGAAALLAARLTGGEFPVAFTLHTPEIEHTREIIPTFELDDPGRIATWRDGSTVAQLALPIVRGLAVDFHAAACPVHFIGLDDSVLLTLSGAEDEVASAYWRTVVHEALPGLAAQLPPFP